MRKCCEQVVPLCMQEQAEVLQWLEDDMGVSSRAFTELKADRAALHAMRVQPELAAAKANVGALKELLHMSDAQVSFATCKACVNGLFCLFCLIDCAVGGMLSDMLAAIFLYFDRLKQVCYASTQSWGAWRSTCITDAACIGERLPCDLAPARSLASMICTQL